jgi:hypothetical protein
VFKDLHKLVQEQQQPEARKQLYGRLRNKEFWFWDIAEHTQEYIRTRGDCCFNHIIGLPQKEAIDKPLFSYEQIIYDTLQDHKHTWIKKATGLGVSEFMLRYMAWLCLKDNALAGSQMCIVTGPRIELSIALVDRMKALFKTSHLGSSNIITFDTKETVVELNNVKVEAFPSHHLDAMRGLQNVSFILLDEADFFPPGQQQDARDVSERYIAKSNPYIVMVSTPNAPDGLFERIEKEAEDTCLYKRLLLDYTYGLDKIYSREEIEQAKQSPSFEREYNCKYLGKIGNVFHTKDIEAAIQKGKLYDPDFSDPYHFHSRSMGIDPAWGSSAFGIVVTQWADGIIQVLYAEEFERPDYSQMLDIVLGLMTKYKVDLTYVDGANPSFIRSLKLQIGEKADYLEELDRAANEGFKPSDIMKIIPVSFAKDHKAMLGHVKLLMEKDGEGCIAIHPRFQKLLTALRTATDRDGTLLKEETSYDDLLDALRLSLKFYRFDQQQQ